MEEQEKDEDDLVWETLSDGRPRKRMNSAQRAYLKRAKKRPQNEAESKFAMDLFAPLGAEREAERERENDTDNEGQGQGQTRH